MAPNDPGDHFQPFSPKKRPPWISLIHSGLFIFNIIYKTFERKSFNLWFFGFLKNSSGEFSS